MRQCKLVNQQGGIMALFDISFNGTTYTGVKEMMFVEGNLLIKGFTYEGEFYKQVVINPELKDFEIERSDIDETKISMEEMARSFQSVEVSPPVQTMPLPQE